MDVTLAVIAMAFVVAAVLMIIMPPIRTQVFSVKSVPAKNWLTSLALIIVAALLLVAVFIS